MLQASHTTLRPWIPFLNPIDNRITCKHTSVRPAKKERKKCHKKACVSCTNYFIVWTQKLHKIRTFLFVCTEMKKLMLLFLDNLLTCQKMLLVMCLIARKTKRNTSQLTSEGCMGFCLLPLPTIVVVIARRGCSCNGLVWGTDLDRWKCRHNFSWIEFWNQVTKKSQKEKLKKNIQ